MAFWGGGGGGMPLALAARLLTYTVHAASFLLLGPSTCLPGCLRFMEWPASSDSAFHALIKSPPASNPSQPTHSTQPPKPNQQIAFGEPKTVCVRTAETAEDVEEVILDLRNTTGRKVKPLKKPVVSRLPSVQVRRGWVGGWDAAQRSVGVSFF